MIMQALAAIEQAAISARHAERLSTSAALAFANEARTLELAAANMRHMAFGVDQVRTATYATYGTLS